MGFSSPRIRSSIQQYTWDGRQRQPAIISLWLEPCCRLLSLGIIQYNLNRGNVATLEIWTVCANWRRQLSLSQRVSQLSDRLSSFHQAFLNDWQYGPETHVPGKHSKCLIVMALQTAILMEKDLTHFCKCRAGLLPPKTQ